MWCPTAVDQHGYLLGNSWGFCQPDCGESMVYVATRQLGSSNRTGTEANTRSTIDPINVQGQPTQGFAEVVATSNSSIKPFLSSTSFSPSILYKTSTSSPNQGVDEEIVFIGLVQVEPAGAWVNKTSTATTVTTNTTSASQIITVVSTTNISTSTTTTTSTVTSTATLTSSTTSTPATTSLSTTYTKTTTLATKIPTVITATNSTITSITTTSTIPGLASKLSYTLPKEKNFLTNILFLSIRIF